MYWTDTVPGVLSYNWNLTTAGISYAELVDRAHYRHVINLASYFVLVDVRVDIYSFSK